jgi:hypothetical protein
MSFVRIQKVLKQNHQGMDGPISDSDLLRRYKKEGQDEEMIKRGDYHVGAYSPELEQRLKTRAQSFPTTLGHHPEKTSAAHKTDNDNSASTLRKSF